MARSVAGILGVRLTAGFVNVPAVHAGRLRRIELNAAGRGHGMFRTKPPVFEAITVHRDDIERLPPGAVVLASNEMGVQAIELRHGPGTFWGVQYHPEYSFREIAAAALRYAEPLIGEGLFADRAELDAFIAELHVLMRDPKDARLAWKHGLGRAMQEEPLKLAELSNWLSLQVLPHARQRG